MKKRRILQLYETNGLDEHQATLELLRRGIAARRAARGAPLIRQSTVTSQQVLRNAYRDVLADEIQG